MPKRMKVEGGQTSEEVDAVYQRCANPHDQKRLLALQMAQQGQWTMQQIAQAIGKGRATIGRWIKAYRQDGISGLLGRGHGGRRPKLKADDIDALKEGLRNGQWKSGGQIRQWLKDQRGIKLSQSGVYYWLSQVRASWKVLRKRHTQQDPDQKEDF